MSFNRLRSLFSRNGNGHLEAFPPRVKPKEKVPDTSLEEKQSLLAHLVKLVVQKHSFGLFVFGQGGAGKSKTISETLTAEGVVPVIINSHITPMSLYKTMFQNRTGKVLWLDDCDSIYGNLQVLGLLRSALWGQGQRLVTYTSTQLDDLPSRFIFDSRIIFCANCVPKRNDAFRAVLSRVDVFELSATNEEIIEQMRHLADRGYGSMTSQQCHDVVDFIEDSGGTRQLSMRLFEPSMRKVLYANEAEIDWRDLVRCQLDQMGLDHNVPKADGQGQDLRILHQALQVFPNSVKAQEEFWCKATGKSRASFFRVKKSDQQSSSGE